jgi:hypothetical protein
MAALAHGSGVAPLDGGPHTSKRSPEIREGDTTLSRSAYVSATLPRPPTRVLNARYRPPGRLVGLSKRLTDPVGRRGRPGMGHVIG